MKIMKKALALFIALIMVIGVVPAYAESNGIEIDATRYFTTDDAGESPIATTGNPGDVVVNAGETFYLHLKFAGNPTTEPTICDITLLVGYDSAKVTAGDAYGIDIAPQMSTAWNGTDVVIAAWADAGGIKSKGKILAEGTIFTAAFTAKEDLTEDYIAKNIKILDSASSMDNGSPVTQSSLFKDKVGGVFDVNWLSNLQEKELPPVITVDASKFTVNLSDKTWTGSAIEPEVTSSIPAEVYTVTYGANTDLGKGTITIALNGPDADGFVWVGDQRYAGEDIALEFNIVAKAIAEADFDLSAIANTTYTGSAIEPAVTSATLTSDDYTVAYADNTDVGTATVTVTGKGNYSGSFTKTFKITAKSIEATDFEFDIDDAGYDFKGSAIEPAVTPLTGLVEDQDYTVTYSNNSMAGVTGKVIVKGINNYTGSITKEFKIKAEQLAADGEITLGIGFTSTNDDATSYDADAKISEVAAGEKFVMWVNVGNNGVDSLDDTIAAYDLLLQYDNSKIKLTTCSDAVTNPEINLAFNANTIMASWANNKGITLGMPAKLQKEATLFVVVAEALEDLDAAELADVMGYVTSATSTAGNAQTTSFVRRDRSPYNIKEVTTLVAITNSHVVVNPLAKDYTYTGSEIIPEITLNNIEEGQYEIAYTNNVNVGTATATVTGLGNFYGTFDVEFEIVPKEITEADFALAEKQVVYTGSAIEVDVISDLVETQDYTVAYTNNVDYGTATVTITGANNYTGTVVMTFDIVKKELKDSYFTIEATKEYADGADIEVVITTDLAEGTDFTATYSNNVNVGTATIVFTGIGNYEGTVTKTFEIVARDLVDADFTINPASYEYTGSEIIPTVVTALTAGKDYVVTYSDNTNAGTATATFTGKGNYTGEIVKTFTIDPKAASATDFDLTAITDATYTGLPIEPIVSSSTLVEGRDYEVVYENNTNAGTATVKVIGKGNYDFEIVETFVIEAKDITDGDFALASTQVVYTGSAIEPGVITMLVNGSDFDVAYDANTNVGPATATITGKGNYKGTVTKTFEIVAKDITEADFTFDLDDKVYTGSAIEPVVTSTLGAGNYAVTYMYNENVGTASIIVAGAGNYKGNIVKNFKIVPAAITNADFTFGDPEAWYDSKKDAATLAEGIKVAVTAQTGLVADQDYEVIFTNNTAAGTATVTVKGIGNYTGKVEDTFVINTFRLGDVDNDTTWSTLDAVRILKMATDLYTNPTDLEKKAAEVVADGKYNAVDALEVLKYSALIEGTLYTYFGNQF